MLSEDRRSTSIASVYTKIEHASDVSISREDPFDTGAKRHHGLSRQNPHVPKTSSTVVVIPSHNKWNCFSERDRKTVDVNVARDQIVMNAATSVGTTAALELNNLPLTKVTRTLPDYSTKTERLSGNDLVTSNTGYRRLTLREKVEKQRLERENGSKRPKNVPPTNTDSNPRGKAVSSGNASTATSSHHIASGRSQSIEAITEERTVFGFKVMKGLQDSSGSVTENDNKIGFTRHASLRRLVRLGNYKTVNKVKDELPNSSFYKPNPSMLHATNTKTEDLDNKDVENKKNASCGFESKLDVITSQMIPGNDMNEDKNVANEGRCLNVADKNKMKQINPYDVSKKNITMQVDATEAEILKQSEMAREEGRKHGSVTRGHANEKKVENEDHEKTSDKASRAESLREGKSRLEKFREKQRRGILTRSLTNPDFAQNDSTAQIKDRNVSESLAEIRERIRERSQKKERLKKSKSLPEVESSSMQNRVISDLVCRKEHTKQKDEVKIFSRGEEMHARKKSLPSEQKEPVESNLTLSVEEKIDEMIESSKVTENETAAREQKKEEVKKPTKRERRKLERYQRSKTMSAIMYNEISLEAEREMKHKESRQTSDKTNESVAIPSVSELKKKFLETEKQSSDSNMSEMALYYPGKKAKNATTSKRTDIVFADETQQSEANKGRCHSKKTLSRRHTIAVTCTLQNNANMQEGEENRLKHNYVAKENKKWPKSSQTNSFAKRESRSSSESSKEYATGKKEKIARRHTFSGQSDMVPSCPSLKKPSESIEKLRELFSKGGPSSPSISNSSNMKNNTLRDESNRKRIKSDSSIETKQDQVDQSTKTEICPNKNNPVQFSLRRRHTIANRPLDVKQDAKKDREERKEFLDKFDKEGGQNKKEKAAYDEKNSEAQKKVVGPVGEQKIQDKLSTFNYRKKNKEEKMSVSKLRKLFLGQGDSVEKKGKQRERRAKTIAGSEITKDMDIKSDFIGNKISNTAIVEADLYVKDLTRDEAEAEQSNTQHTIVDPDTRRRSSDLNPTIYVQLLGSSDGTEPDSVFSEEKNSQQNISCKVSCGEFERKEESLSALDLTRKRSGSDSEMNKTKGSLIKDQSLDDYLTTIKNLSKSPVLHGVSLRGRTAAVEKSHPETLGQYLDVAKTNLILHSWSTSDLDKIFHGGEKTDFHHCSSEMELTSVDFDEISSTTTRLQSLTEGRTKTRPKRTSSRSLNPIKSLMERSDIRTNTEVPADDKEQTTSGFEKPKKRTQPRKKRAQLEPWRRHTLDPVALAALASREDFSRVSLRKTKGRGKEKDEYDGSLPVMLIQIKGRRQVQTRLVEPKLFSLNTGDCFILVTSKELFCWIGKDANTIEKAKAVEISSKIQKRGDMNCKTGDVLYIDETKQRNSLAYKKFCKILEGDTDHPIEDSHLCPDDEFYEREVISTNKIYKVQEGDPPHLIPVSELCGYMPRIGILSTKEVLIFDFGSELYVWNGQQSLSAKRKVAFHLAEMLYAQRFECEAVINPIEPRRALKRSQSKTHVYRGEDGKEQARPVWTLFCRLHEKAETLLFQEKFFDWPDPTKIIKMKGHISSGEIAERPPPAELTPCNANEMQKPSNDLEPVVLEATNLGRGLGTPNVEVNGQIKEGDLVTTLGMTVWLITQNKHFVLPKTSEGHFHSGDGYVIRWVYFVAKNRIVKDKRGRVRPLTGRQRCAYFFWQGNACSVNEKGAAAIMAVELDEEHGPQVRVVEGKEPPHFLKLFNGAMVIHSGKRIRVNEREEFSDNSTVRMYCIRNEDLSEVCLVQVRASCSSLRSRSSFLLVDCKIGKVYIWHGCKSTEFHRSVAERAANLIKERPPLEMNLHEEATVTLMTVQENEEPESFWTTLDGKKSNYLSLVKDPLNYNFCPRLFHMTSAPGHFTAIEILSPSRYPGRVSTFPVLQDDLYSATQPATFLLDVGNEVYIWEGWMPREIAKDKRGSAKRRWDEERKLTLQTALAYVKEANKRITKGAFVVQAGLEPLCFTSRFPFWNTKEQITEIKLTEGKQHFEKKQVEEVLDNLTQKYYTFRELSGENPPDGVDPSKLETYLTEEEFEKIFEMSRALFSKLPGWKQDILKKAFGLF